MRSAFCLLLAAAALHAAVDGTIVNGTTGRPQAGVPVTLVMMGGAGMQPQGSTTSDQSGKFSFPQTLGSMALLQATHQGVTYNLVVQQGAPSTGLTLEVYNVSPRPGAAKVVEDVVLLEPMGSELSVRENIIWQNGGKETFHDSAAGTTRFYAPPEAASTLQVAATAPGGLPVEHAATPAGPANIYKVDFPIKPGNTSFEISYRVPLSSPGSFSGRAVQKDAPLRLAVPAGVTVKGEGLELLGQEPQSRASVYAVKTPEYSVEIEGTGSMGAASGGADEGGGSGLNQILPRVYGSVYAILGLAFVILALGFVLLYRKKAPVPASPPPAAPPKTRARK